MAEKVVFAVEDVTLHQVQGVFDSPTGQQHEDVAGVSLKPGDTLPLSSLASYQREAAENGELFGVELLTEKEAEKKSAEVERLRAAAAGGAAGVPLNFLTTSLTGPDADDGSFSDHLLADDERVANHAARGADEAGEAGTDDKVTVAGAEEESSPAASGRKTGTKVSEKVQGSGGAEASDSDKE